MIHNVELRRLYEAVERQERLQLHAISNQSSIILNMRAFERELAGSLEKATKADNRKGKKLMRQVEHMLRRVTTRGRALKPQQDFLNELEALLAKLTALLDRIKMQVLFRSMTLPSPIVSPIVIPLQRESEVINLYFYFSAVHTIYVLSLVK